MKKKREDVSPKADNRFTWSRIRIHTKQVGDRLYFSFGEKEAIPLKGPLPIDDELYKELHKSEEEGK